MDAVSAAPFAARSGCVPFARSLECVAARARRRDPSSTPGCHFLVAPAATLERLLYVVPAMAAFIAAREMGRWWGGRRLWIMVAPVIGVALMECCSAFRQIHPVGDVSAGPHTVRGTYVNRNHILVGFWNWPSL